MPPIISRDAAVRILTSAIPNAEWLLCQIESQDGWFRFPASITRAITNLKIDSYPLLYENETAIARMLQLAFFDESEISEFNLAFEIASIEDRGGMLEEVASSIEDVIDSIEIPKTPKQQADAQKVFDALNDVEQKEAILFAQRWQCYFLSTFFQHLSLMVHGEKLTSLVAQAKTGDDDAYVKAVQIDRRILMVIPFFKERFVRAQDEGDIEFNDKISYRLKCAPYRGKIRFKSLWLSFSFLDQLGLLDTLSHNEILQICDDAGVGGFKNRIEDVKNLSKRLNDYRVFQRRGVVSTP